MPLRLGRDGPKSSGSRAGRRRSLLRRAGPVAALSLVATILTGSIASRAEEADPVSTIQDEPVVASSAVEYPGRGGVSEVAIGSELPGLRTAFSSSYETEIPGMLRLDVSTEPINFQTSSGEWHRIDTDLVQQDDGAGFRATANSATVEIADTADAEALAAVDLGDGVRTSFALEGAADVELRSVGGRLTVEVSNVEPLGDEVATFRYQVSSSTNIVVASGSGAACNCPDGFRLSRNTVCDVVVAYDVRCVGAREDH